MNFYGSGLKTYNQLRSNLTVFGALIAVDYALDITYHIYDINYSCYYGAFEAYMQLLKYTDFLGDPLILVWNIVYNIGIMYQMAKDSIMYFLDPTKSKVKNSF